MTMKFKQLAYGDKFMIVSKLINGVGRILYKFIPSKYSRYNAKQPLILGEYEEVEEDEEVIKVV